MGANFRGLLNDLKRRPQDAAKELGLEVDAVEAMLSGTEEIPQEVITKATELWPVNARDFYLFHDDTPHGVKTHAGRRLGQDQQGHGARRKAPIMIIAIP